MRGLLHLGGMVQVLTVRQSDAGDLAAVDALLSRAYPKLLKADYPPSVLVTALPIISRARPELLASGTYYVAEHGPEGGEAKPDGASIVGAGGWTMARRSGWADIRHFVTDDRQVRKGIGRALMARILADAALAGVREFACQATRTAVPFYQAMGFVVMGPFEVALRPGISFPAIQMYRRL